MKFDPIRLIEYGANFAKQKEPYPKRKAKKDKKDFTFKDYIKFQQEFEAFEDWRKDKEDKAKKLAKLKETKKEGVSAAQIAFFLVASFPITAPAYVYYFKMLLKSME